MQIVCHDQKLVNTHIFFYFSEINGQHCRFFPLDLANKFFHRTLSVRCMRKALLSCTDKHETRTLYPHRCAGLMFEAKLGLFVSKLRLLLQSLDVFGWAASAWLCCWEPLAFLSSHIVRRTHKKVTTALRQTQARYQLSSEKAQWPTHRREKN